MSYDRTEWDVHSADQWLQDGMLYVTVVDLR